MPFLCSVCCVLVLHRLSLTKWHRLQPNLCTETECLLYMYMRELKRQTVQTENSIDSGNSFGWLKRKSIWHLHLYEIHRWTNMLTRRAERNTSVHVCRKGSLWTACSRQQSAGVSFSRHHSSSASFVSLHIYYSFPPHDIFCFTEINFSIFSFPYFSNSRSSTKSQPFAADKVDCNPINSSQLDKVSHKNTHFCVRNQFLFCSNRCRFCRIVFRGPRAILATITSVSLSQFHK